MSRTPARLGVVTLAAGAALLVAAPALAHVSVSSTDATKEGYGKATFRVPNEADSDVTRVAITFPQDTPFASVTAQTKPGWRAEVETAKLDEPVTSGDATLTEGVRTVTWTAEDGAGIETGEFDEFAFSGGPFPDAGEVIFTAEQAYDDGEVAVWDQVAKEGAEEPERPAPVLSLASATTDGHGGPGTASTAPVASTPSDSLARALSLAALALGAGALVLGLRENRRRA